MLLIDSGTTRDEGHRLAADVLALTGRPVTHVVLTHHHFDHVLGSSVFVDAALYAAPGVVEAMTVGAAHLATDAVGYGADAHAVEAAAAELRPPGHLITATVTLDLGGRAVDVLRPGRGHTHDDVIVVVPAVPTVVFCGDLIEESGEPAIADDSDVAAWPTTLDRLLAIGGPDAVYVPGHGAVVDATFVARQREWLKARL